MPRIFADHEYGYMDEILHLNNSKDFPWTHRIPILDITNKCRLQCGTCMRLLDPSSIRRGGDMPVEDYKKVVAKWDRIALSGQIGDAIYHPQFQDILYASEPLDYLMIATNGSGKKEEWWDKTYSICNEIGLKPEWRFALDGLPNESHIHRVNQDGNQVFEMMKKGVEYDQDIVWQYIVFNYNEDHIEEAREIAMKEGMTFEVKLTYRFPEGLKPNNPEYIIERFS